MILEVELDSPAKKAGLVVGDIVVGFNKAPTKSHQDLHRLLTKDLIGKPVEIEIIQAEKLVKLTISSTEDELS